VWKNSVYKLKDPRVSARGGKSARLKTQDCSPVMFKTTKALQCPFGPGNYDKNAPTARMNLNVRLDDGEALSFFKELDEWAIKYITANSERLLGWAMTEVQVSVKYHSLVKQREGFEPMLHAKINTEEPHALRYWDKEGALRSAPKDWRQARLQLQFHVSHLWIMATGFGLTCNVLDAQVESEESECNWTCPF